MAPVTANSHLLQIMAGATLAQGATARPFGTSRYKARAEQAEADLAVALALLVRSIHEVCRTGPLLCITPWHKELRAFLRRHAVHPVAK